MLGVPGWSAETVSRILGSTFFYTLRGAVPKRDDPYRRIIHNSSHEFNEVSLNDCLINNSTEYISFKDRVELFKTVKFYGNLDLKDGYETAGFKSIQVANTSVRTKAERVFHRHCDVFRQKQLI